MKEIRIYIKGPWKRSGLFREWVHGSIKEITIPTNQRYNFRTRGKEEGK